MSDTSELVRAWNASGDMSEGDRLADALVAMEEQRDSALLKLYKIQSLVAPEIHEGSAQHLADEIKEALK